MRAPLRGRWLRCALLLLCACALAATPACYRPNAPGGSYLCGTDEACPDGLSCTCGMCVSSEDEAACGFSIVVTDPKPNMRNNGVLTLNVAEHEKFTVQVTALRADGSPAIRFAGSAKLSSTWGDVCVGDAGCTTLPDRIQFSAGVAMSHIQLNRETPSPQSAILRAELAGHVGTSGQLRINVNAERFVREAAPVIPSLSLTGTFGYAKYAVGAPYVLKSPDGWRMYFAAGSGTLADARITIGVASAPESKVFAPPANPLFAETSNASDEIFGAVSALATDGKVRLFYGRQSATDTAGRRSSGYRTLVSRSAPGFDGPFTPDPPELLLTTLGNSDCDYCSAFDQPDVIHDPNPALSGGDQNALLMYFSALPLADADGYTDTVSVVRASSPTGAGFAVDPSAILKPDDGETVIYSPRVLLDGTIYKMWYSVTGYRRAAMSDVPPTNPCLVPPAERYSVGYATSSDGYFWVRSPTNLNTNSSPLNPGAAGAWDEHSLLVGSVVPSDGVDPSKGIDLYYSPLMSVLAVACLPNGVGRARRR